MSKLHELAEIGQSVWLDYIRRSFIKHGKLDALIEMGITGMTSNPSIFEKAINGSDDYTKELKQLIHEGKSVEEIYSSLVIDDIQMAADQFRPIYDQTAGADGFISLEVDPRLAQDTQKTLDEARRLWSTVDRPNLMVKIPATQAGITAIRQAVAWGVNVNVTLIFSLARYAEVMQAYLEGLEERLKNGQPIDRIASVASFFVSRVDTKVDKRLEAIIRQEGPQAALAASLRGKAAVANARLAYQQFQEVFGSKRFLNLRAAGARVQRPLWASTSTKNPAYSDIKYVQELIAPDTVNTLPLETIQAFLDHGQPHITIADPEGTSERVIQALEDLGISMDHVTQELEDEGVEAFASSFIALLENIAMKQDQAAQS